MSPDKGPEQHVRDSPSVHHSASTATAERSASRQPIAGQDSNNRGYGDRSCDQSDVDYNRRSRHDESSWRHHRPQRDQTYDSHSDRQHRAYDNQRSRQRYSNSSRRDNGYARRYSPVNRGYSPVSQTTLPTVKRTTGTTKIATRRALPASAIISATTTTLNRTRNGHGRDPSQAGSIFISVPTIVPMMTALGICTMATLSTDAQLLFLNRSILDIGRPRASLPLTEVAAMDMMAVATTTACEPGEATSGV
ncbi:hypothetical protein H4S04_003307 [Coemansia sp. S16]|nr:hypothetical protein H4S04_003307 [Coemansia sp. S16]